MKLKKPYVFHDDEQIKKFRKDPVLAMEYLNSCVEVAFEENEPELILNGLAVIARAYGMTRLAKKSYLQRESLHRMLSKRGNPEWNSIFRVLKALRIRMKMEFSVPAVA